MTTIITASFSRLFVQAKLSQNDYAKTVTICYKFVRHVIQHNIYTNKHNNKGEASAAVWEPRAPEAVWEPHSGGGVGATLQPTTTTNNLNNGDNNERRQQQQGQISHPRLIVPFTISAVGFPMMYPVNPSICERTKRKRWLKDEMCSNLPRYSLPPLW